MPSIQSSVQPSIPYAALTAVLLIGYFFVWPLIVYFRDAKGLRRFHNFAPLSGASNIPFMVLAHGGARSSHLTQLHKTHPILRTGTNTLSFGDVRAIKDIYGHGSPCTKDDQYNLLAGTHYHLADVTDKHDHQRKRKILSSAYALKNLEGWEHKVSDKVERTFAHFDSVCTRPLAKGQVFADPGDLTVDCRAWTNFFSLDAIADIGLSERLGLLDRGHDRVDARRMDGTVYECSLRESLYPVATKQSLLSWTYDWYKIIDKVSDLVPYYRRLSSKGKHWDAIVVQRAALRLERYRAGEKLDDFFQALMENKNGEPNSMEWGEIVAEINIMMNAGSVTTAIALANVLHQLICHPDVLQRLRDEVDAVLDPDEVVAPYDKVKHLPYLRACLDESLRLHPPTPHGLTRKTPPEGMHVMGEWIPGNTTVAVSALVAHRSAAFKDADHFQPERWLGEDGKKLQSYFISFSAGARGCIGRNISYLEQTVFVASMVHRYGFALAEGFEMQRRETMNWILGEMPIKIWRRDLGTE
ncbi:cytochrome p450 oxidoreductase [Emericellopsis cladophorae]|uniref:Cytochrome p450 oxidoreductase n=1 Tax=Emericellopsis cladophorae TaxID=2686198 RepID=A0A9Q0BAU5_9HYPO|nr:cytochrome p450 oxidoreductase [Emericellopsis cladophorae]KAI6778612.1 cytochrome p450 oxidoreductase [Emericellopsis cladophorae]